MKPFSSQIIAITGAGSGLGRAVAARCIADGAMVVALDANADALAATQNHLGTNFIPARCDVGDRESVEQALAAYPVIDALVNSAGITGTTNQPSHESDPRDVERVFRINFTGSYLTARAVLPGMLARGYGRVLHIASIAGKEGNAGMLAYSASKAAVIGMAKVQGKECAGSGVTVNALAPAVIRTPMVEAMPVDQVRYMTDKIPMQRCGSLDELVAMVRFIISPECSFTTGFCFDLSGGRATY